MTRVKRGFVARKRRNKIISFAKGFVGSHRKLYTVANQQVMKSHKYAYNDRRKKKTNFKFIWIKRINLASQKYKLNYNQVINKLKRSRILLNKKVLSSLIINDCKIFEKLIA